MKKKYGKTPWIKTPLARPFLRRVQFWRAKRSMVMSAMAGVTASNIAMIRAAANIPEPLKSLYMGKVALNLPQAIKQWQESHPPPREP